MLGRSPFFILTFCAFIHAMGCRSGYRTAPNQEVDKPELSLTGEVLNDGQSSDGSTSDPMLDPTIDPSSSPDPEVQVLDPLPSKSCCLCMYFNDDDNHCLNLPLSDCEVNGCIIKDDICTGKLMSFCHDWLQKSADQCDWSGVVEQDVVGLPNENGDYTFSQENLKGVLPEGCTELRIQQFTHSNHLIGCQRLNEEIKVCLEMAPECKNVIIESAACHTFDNRITSDDFINKLVTDYPGVNFEVTSHQDFVILDPTDFSCRASSAKTYKATCDGNINVSWEPCSSPSSKYCDASLNGQQKVCTDEMGNPSNVVCCCDAEDGQACEYKPGLVCN